MYYRISLSPYIYIYIYTINGFRNAFDDHLTYICLMILEPLQLCFLTTVLIRLNYQMLASISFFHCSAVYLFLIGFGMPFGSFRDSFWDMVHDVWIPTRRMLHDVISLVHFS